MPTRRPECARRFHGRIEAAGWSVAATAAGWARVNPGRGERVTVAWVRRRGEDLLQGEPDVYWPHDGRRIWREMTAMAEPERTATEKDAAYNRCLQPFRNMHYADALRCFESFLERTDLEPKDSLKARLNAITCHWELWSRDRPIPGWETALAGHLDAFLGALEAIDLAQIAPQPTADCLRVALEFRLAVEPIERLRERTVETLKRFWHAARGKGYQKTIQIALAQVDSERRNFSRRDHAERATALAHGILEAIRDDEQLAPARAWLNNVLADLTYFHPLADEEDRVRFERVARYLDAALAESPSDMFARTFRRFIERLAETTLQIKRFGHDVKTRQANIWNLLERLERHLAGDARAQALLSGLQREIGGIHVAGQVAARAQVAESEWRRLDPGELVAPLLRERGWPDACLQIRGLPRPWQLCPDFVRLTLDNLLRNIVEAYGRRGMAPPELPCLITIDHEQSTITVRDWAGGIDHALGDVFEPYVSSKGVRSNTGLGLTQARDALRVQSPGFELRLSPSQPPDGASFDLVLPGASARRAA